MAFQTAAASSLASENDVDSQANVSYTSNLQAFVYALFFAFEPGNFGIQFEWAGL